MAQLTRRQLLGGGAVLGGVAVAGGYGHFALGDDFEKHVASVLGISPEAAKSLTDLAHDRLGDWDYRVKASQFLAVTTFPGEELSQVAGRNRGIREFVTAMIGDSYENLVYLGVQQPRGGSVACAGLVQR
jgi:hypothetical protein